jgi:PTH1 family peptidyl-tRNA hydrolase
MDGWYFIVGLGNPGAEYARTRHNAGFMALEAAAAKWGARWNREAQLECRLAIAHWAGRKVLLGQPQTYMNESGRAVSRVASFYQVAIDRVLVVADDADLPLGTLRLRPGGSGGGHHGLESVERSLGARNYARLRMGIGRACEGQREITRHVLGRLSAEERQVIDAVLVRVVAQLECWLTEGTSVAMNRFNGALVSPKSQASE